MGDADEGLADLATGPAPDPPAGPAELTPTGLFGRQAAVLTIIACFGLLAAACAFAAVLAWRDIQAAAAVVDAREARRAGTLAFEAMLNAESQQRGYLLMRDPTYLASYHDDKTAFDRAVDGLRRRLAERPRRAESGCRRGADRAGEVR